ncbi:MAG: AAA family ATPase, partial [Deinococcus sp.]|nr:AAA family ATPase [Deinococcus sp.]
MKPKALDTKQPKLLPLPVEALKRSTNPRRFSFSTTAELEPLTEFPGQSRAVDSVRFGLGIRHEGYNLFVLGPSGTGKRAVVRHFTHEQAQSGAKPSDWAYVHNFSEPHKPKMLRLPPGRGGALKQEMERLIEELRAAIPAAFESEDYRTRRQVIDQQYK